MSRQLNQNEIDAVFRKVKSTSDGPSRAAVPFDFRRPDRIAKSQVNAIHLLHENFVRNLSASLSAYLRTYLTVNLISVEQLSYGELLEGLPSPTCLVSVGLQPFDGNALIELNPSLVFPIIEIILGGNGRNAANLKREITEIEQSLLGSLFAIILNDLKEAWKSVALIDFKIEALAAEPQTLQILAAHEAVVAVGIEIRIGDNSGTLNLAIPSLNIKMISQKFDQQWSMRRAEPTEADQRRMQKLIRGASSELDARLRGPKLAVRDLLEIEAGDVLHFDYRTDQPLDFDINGRPKFRGRVIRSGEKRAFVIDAVPAIGA